jgi:hypothetical protein
MDSEHPAAGDFVLAAPAGTEGNVTIAADRDASRR